MAVINIERILLIWTLTLTVFYGEFVASQEYNCSEVKCPALSKIDCPADSYERDIQEYHTISTNDDDQIVEEIFINCCVTKKCACKLCFRPSCHNASLVLMETIKETQIPGKCCGEYDCIREPNCTEIQSTNGYGWLIDCQHCVCSAGEKICYRSCDEIRLPPANCIGQNSKIFSNGQTWKENECTNCECQNGEKKCQTSFCKSLSCPYKVKYPGECCAVCVDQPPTTTSTSSPESPPTPQTPPIHIPPPSVPPTKSISTTTTTFSPTPSSSPSSPSTPSPPLLPPCAILTTEKTTKSSEIYPVRTEYFEVIQTTKTNCILYGIIAALSISLIVSIALYCYERSKQRSYRPVASLDDNYNKIKIKNCDF